VSTIASSGARTEISSFEDYDSELTKRLILDLLHKVMGSARASDAAANNYYIHIFMNERLIRSFSY
jgi:hypothetical protein